MTLSVRRFYRERWIMQAVSRIVCNRSHTVQILEHALGVKRYKLIWYNQSVVYTCTIRAGTEGLSFYMQEADLSLDIQTHALTAAFKWWGETI